MTQKDREMLQDIVDDLMDRMVGIVADTKRVTLPEPIRTTFRENERR